MKIISSFMDDLLLQKGLYHSITFESSYIQSQFRELLMMYFQRKIQSDCHYLKILNDEQVKINSKDLYFIVFDCNIINLKSEKSSVDLIQKLLYHQLENNPNLIQEYLNFNAYIDKFISNVEIITDNLRVDFQLNEKAIKQFIKSLEVTIEYNEDGYVPNHIMRQFLIQSMLKMNVTEKEVLLLVSYPETDIGSNDYEVFVETLKQFKITTIVLTTSQEFMTAADEDCMFMIDRKGNLYDVIKLKKELIAFEFINRDNTNELVTKALAFKDFKKDYFLMDKEKKSFLLSDKY